MGDSSLPFKRKLGYSVGHVLNDLTASMWFTYLIAYFHEVKRFDDTLAGYLMLIGQTVDALFTPLIGVASDRSHTGICRMGRRKSWHVIGTLCIVLSFPFIFIPCWFCHGVPDWAQFIYYFPIIVLFQFGWASVQISHLALIPEMTKSPVEKVQLNGWRYATTVMCYMTVYLLAWLLFYLHGPKDTKYYLNEEDSHIFRDLAVYVTALGLIFSAIFYRCIHERDNHVSGSYKKDLSRTRRKSTSSTEITVPTVSGSICNYPNGILKSTNGKRDSPREKPYSQKSWRKWMKETIFYQTALIYMCSRLVVNISHIYMPMYITESLQMGKDSVAVVPLVGYLAGFFTSLFMNNTNRILGRKRTYIIGQSCTLGACIWMFFVNKETSSRVYGVAALSGIGGSTVLVTSLAMTTDLIDTRSDNAAFVYGSMTFVDKIANGIAVVLIQRFNPCRGPVPTLSDECTVYYRDVLVSVPGGLSFVSLLVLLSMMPSIGGRDNTKETRVRINSEPEEVTSI